MASPVIAGKRELRTLELKAFGGVVDAFRAQGALTERKQEVLNSLAEVLNVDEDRGKCEMRRAANDEQLSSIAGTINGHGTEHAWRSVSTQRIPYAPMRPQENVYSSFADQIAHLMSRCKKNSALDACLEDVHEANTQMNIEELGEQVLLDSYLASKDSDDEDVEAILLEAGKIEKCSYNQFTQPDEYVRMISCVKDDTNEESFVRRLPTFASLSDENAAKRKNLSKTGSSFAPRLNQLLEEDSKQNREVPAARVPSERSIESEFRLPLARSTRGRVVSKATRVKSSSRKPSKRGRTVDNSIAAVINEEPTRMVRKAKLNAKRWNPKTQTLESPSSKTAETVPAVTKTSPSVRSRPSKESVRRKVIVVAESDDAEKAASSKKRSRRAPRLSFGRKRRRRTKPANEVESSGETGTGISDMDSLPLDESISDIEESSKKAKTTVENTNAANDRSHSPAFDLDLSERNEWLQKLESEPRRINILRKRVFVGGSQIEPVKKFCEQPTSIEMSKNNPPEDPNRDSESIMEVAKNEVGMCSTTESASAEQSKETTPPESVELVLDTSTVDDSPAETKTNRDFVPESEVNDAPMKTCSETEIVPNSSSNAHEAEANCDSTRNSKDSIGSSSIIPAEGEAKLKLSTKEPESTKPSDHIAEASPSTLKRVKISIPGSGNTITVGIPIATGAEQPKGIRTLPPSCDKMISERLLGNCNVRVRSRKSSPPDIDHLEATLASEPDDLETTEMSTSALPSPIDSERAELSDDNRSDENLVPEEIVLSTSEDEISSDSAIASNNAGSEGSNESNAQLYNSNVIRTITLDEDGSCETENVDNDDITDAVSVIDEGWSDADSAANSGTYSFEDSVGKKISAS